MFDALGRGGSKKKFGSEDRSLPIGEKRRAKLRRARAIAETPSVNSLGPRMIRLRYVLGNAGSLRQSKMELHAANLDRRKTSSMILARRQRSLRARDRASRNYYKSHSTCGRSRSPAFLSWLCFTPCILCDRSYCRSCLPYS